MGDNSSSTTSSSGVENSMMAVGGRGRDGDRGRGRDSGGRGLGDNGPWLIVVGRTTCLISVGASLENLSGLMLLLLLL